MDNFNLNKKQRLRLLYETGLHSDCRFIVDKQEIPAHKFILSSSSLVFEKMFYGDFASDEVKIVDIQPEDFRQALEFIYLDDVQITSINNAWALFYIAHKYFINDLIRMCLDYIEENLTIGNLLLCYEYAEMYQQDALKQCCLIDIVNYTKGIFSELNYYHMKPTTLATILAQDSLNVEHVWLFQGIVSWAAVECQERDLDKCSENIVELLKECKLINYMYKLDITDVDKLDKLAYHTYEMCKNDIYVEGCKKYQKSVWRSNCKSRLLYKITRRTRISEECMFSSLISVNRPTMVFGLELAAEEKSFPLVDCSKSNEYSAVIIVNIKLENDPNDKGYMTTFHNKIPYNTPCYVPLDELVILEADRSYTVTVTYVNLDAMYENSILCYFMGWEVSDDRKKTSVSFNEFGGGVIRGVCFYPV